MTKMELIYLITHVVVYLIMLGLSIFIFAYHKKRKFRTSLANFKNAVFISLFVFCMILSLTIVVMFSLQHFQRTMLYDELMTSGVAAEGKIFYRGIKCKYYRSEKYLRFELGVFFYDPSGKKLKVFIDVDPFNYARLSKQYTLWIHYQRHNPKRIILDDFPPLVDPKDIIPVFSFGLIFVTGVFMWMRRNYICKSCRRLNTHVAIRTPYDLKRVLKMVSKHVADGTVCVLQKKTPRSDPFNCVRPDGPWTKDLEYLFRCNTCYMEFGLSSRTFRLDVGPFVGTGGNWRPQ